MRLEERHMKLLERVAKFPNRAYPSSAESKELIAVGYLSSASVSVSHLRLVITEKGRAAMVKATGGAIGSPT